MTIGQTVLALFSNLQRLLAIRGIVFVFQVITLLYSQWGLQLDLPYTPVWLIMATFIVINVALGLRLQHGKGVSEREFLAHLLMDVLGLSLLMYFTGGASNPFVSYLLVPIMISAATLSGRFTWGVAAISLFAYTVLLFWYRPLPELESLQLPWQSPIKNELMSMNSGMGHDSAGFNLHVMGMWFNFVVSAGLITYFVVKMAGEIRNQQQQLAVLRESTLRDERILAIASQAAGTAHQMGTPLSTMAILLKEMLLEEVDEVKRRDLEVINQQLNYCKKTMRKLVSEAGFDKNDQIEAYALKDIFDQLFDHWQLLRPEVKIQVLRSDRETGYGIKHVSSFQQAVLNLLNNAADAMKDIDEKGLFIEARLTNTEEMWSIIIIDHGAGIRDDVKAKLGSDLFSTKEAGLGMGTMLSHATIERLGGSVHLEDNPSGGTITSIEFPAEKLL